MKILFLQNMHDAIGGITNVNITLGGAFARDGHEVSIISLRNGNYGTVVPYPEELHARLLNPIEEWGCPRYSTAISFCKKGHFLKAVFQIKKRLDYNRVMKKDLEKLKTEIYNINPNIIIVSHYELFYGIPEEYLKKTISHYHTNYEQLKNNKGQVDTFNEFRNRLGAFVWLSEQTCKEAKKDHIEKSYTIYNPLNFHAGFSSIHENKKIVFIGRFSKEKRIDLMVRLFNEVVDEYDKHDWVLDIYGVNKLDENLQELMKESLNVNFKGEAKNPKDILPQYSIFLLTSSFEGFPLVVLEANECGVPCIAFDFGETSHEVVRENTGILVSKNDEAGYKKALIDLMENKQKRELMGKDAKIFASSFQIENIKKKWYDLFEKLR